MMLASDEEDLNSQEMSNEQESDSGDDESQQSEVESVADSIKEGMPESLDTIFASKTSNDFIKEKKANAASLFTKSRHD